MLRMIRRAFRTIFRLSVLAGLGYAVYRMIAERSPGEAPLAAPAPTPTRPLGASPAPGQPEPVRAPAVPRPRAGTKPAGADRPSSAPSQPPPAVVAASAPATSKPPTVRSIGVGEVPADVRKWVEPNGDGSCPPTHPVKAKLESGIFHVPGGQFYDRTKADRCYRDAAAAEADGLRPSKS
ncbi:MAG TPA: hypothetical protein VI916_06385 [Acidimicrobiia bacterium]|nr:hypothetical protein [Acidimicrobiia bacterium]